LVFLQKAPDSRDGKCESRDEGISVSSEAVSKQGQFELQKPATGLNGFLGRHEVNESSGEFALLAPILWVTTLLTVNQLNLGREIQAVESRGICSAGIVGVGM
jgi:hypothetical protein